MIRIFSIHTDLNIVFRLRLFAVLKPNALDVPLGNSVNEKEHISSDVSTLHVEKNA